MSMSIKEQNERITRNVRDVISTLKLLLRFWDDKATPRRPFKAIRWSLGIAVELCELQEPKKPFQNENNYHFWTCPTCKEEIYWDTDYGQEKFKHCTECGQRLDWS